MLSFKPTLFPTKVLKCSSILMILYIPAEAENRSLDQIWMKIIEMIYTVFKGFPSSSNGKASACNAGELGSILRLGRSHGEGSGNPLQYPCLENPMDRRAWRAVQSIGSQRVGIDCVSNTNICLATHNLYNIT